PQLGFRVEGSQVSLAKIGNVKIHRHRPLAGDIKTLTLKNENGKWYACFSCMVDSEPLPFQESVVGIDVGLESFAVTSDAEIVDNYGLIAGEDLNVKGLAGGRLAKSVHDAAWSSFIAKLLYKAESADRLLVKVEARGTSQPCPCGAPVPKKLWDRKHHCTVCGLNTTRDHASALEILRRGLRLRTSMPAIAGMALEAPSFSYGA